MIANETHKEPQAIFVLQVGGSHRRPLLQRLQGCHTVGCNVHESRFADCLHALRDLARVTTWRIGDLVSKVISTLIGVISTYKYSYLIYNPSYKVP